MKDAPTDYEKELELRCEDLERKLEEATTKIVNMIVPAEGECTNRGFAVNNYIDLYGKGFSIQKSSLANDHAIWFGIDNPEPKILASKAAENSVTTTETTGWVTYPMPTEVLINTRMHLSRDHVELLIPVLQHFVDTGDVLLGEN